jgi:hypothetical protein
MCRFWPIPACSFCILAILTAGWSSPESARASDFAGAWHGTLSSRNYESVPVTLLINQGVGAKLTGAVNLISRCLRDADLSVTTAGSNIVLAGTDPDGNTVTFKGSLNDTATKLAVTYIVNGSAGGDCETDDGSGTLSR